MVQTILIVDDSTTMLASLRNALEIAGFKVETATDGMIALNKLENNFNPSLIITDLNMPNMDGIDFIKQVRSKGKFRFKPILVLTTTMAQAKRDESKQAGATAWLVKPVTVPELLRVVKQFLPEK